MKFIMLIVLALSLAFVGCTKEKAEKVINDAKIKAADTVGAAVEKELKEAFVEINISGVDCQAEAVDIGAKATEKVRDFLKVKSAESFNKSLAGSLVPQVCGYVMENVFPELVSKVDTEYVCLRQLGSDKLSKVGKDLCNGLDL